MMTKRTFGVEIEALAPDDVPLAAIIRDLECEGIECQYAGYTHQTTPYWKIVTDYSVCGRGKMGFELVSPKLQGAEGLQQVRVVCEVLQRQGVTVNKTCGLHVHHDAHDYKEQHFVNLFNLYAHAEKALDSVVAKSRRENNGPYCLSLKGRTVSTLRTGRYYKLNLSAFTRHGTVEVRHHQGTVEAEKIVAWVILTQGLVERAKRAVKVHLDPSHSLTLYDVLQAAGLVHAAKAGCTLAAQTRDYFNARRSHFAASAC